MEIIHISLVHQRSDIRIFYKQCLYLQEYKLGNITLIVADGIGDDIISNIKILDIGIPSRNRIGRAILGSIKMWKIFRFLHYDVVHLHDPELLPLGLLLKAKKKIVIFDMHENLPKEIFTKNYINKWVRYPLSYIINFFQQQIFKVIPVVFAENSYIKDFGTAKTSVTVLNYPIIKELNKVITQKRKTFNIGYLGSITKERGLFMQLRAVDELRNEGLEIETTLIGPYSNKDYNSLICQKLVRSGAASFTGRVIPEVGWSLMSKCHVGLAVLESSPNFIESYPTKLFEYMALGIPCIVSDFPLYRKVVEDAQCGLLVDPMDIESIKDAIRRLYYNQNELNRMGENGKINVNHRYSWDSEFLKLKEFYLNLFNSYK
jgi:glycosyltransferase involved in cell wall biosynthesis